jgi:hypothetical protein
MGIVEPIMNIDPMLKLIMINLEDILKSTPDLSTILFLLQQQFQDIIDLFDRTTPIIQELIKDRLDEMNVFFVSVTKEIIDGVGKITRTRANEINDNIKSGNRMIDKNRVDVMEQIYESRSDIMK